MSVRLTLSALILALVISVPVSASAAEFSGWIPYWSGSKGTRDAQRHLDQLDMIHPFAFSVQPDGKLKDLAGLKKSSWAKLIKEARSEDVLVVPTIMWSDTTNIHTILSNEKSRKDHVKRIADMVKKGKYDGVDIDYEGKRSDTKEYFSLFLKDLDAALGSKQLVCTIEARTPPDSLYRTIPPVINYANDFVVINRHCDRVNIMTYDQQRADLKLNDARKGAPYMPVADIDWVEKVARLAMQSIDKNKIVLGAATYGREVEVTVAPDWFKGYRMLWAVNPEYALETAEDHDVEPSRNSAGELSYSYIPEDSNVRLRSSIKIPKNTPEGNIIAARALAEATRTGQEIKFNLVWWSDAKAIEEKIELADKLGLKGVALFKIDGGEDPDIWDIVE
jgi:spore germination protein